MTEGEVEAGDVVGKACVQLLACGCCRCSKKIADVQKSRSLYYGSPILVIISVLCILSYIFGQKPALEVPFVLEEQVSSDKKDNKIFKIQKHEKTDRLYTLLLRAVPFLCFEFLEGDEISSQWDEHNFGKEQKMNK